jgi:AcrR family transcriptional regulator
MPRRGKDTRRRIIDAAYELFYRDGFARAGVDAIAERADITKRTLYQHFGSKDALVAAVLEVQHELALARIRIWAEQNSDDPAALVESLFAGLADWFRKRQWRGSGFTRAAMEFAAFPGHPARRAAHRHKAAVEAWLTQRFAVHGIKTPDEFAREVMILIEGCHSLALIHGDPSYANTALSVSRTLVERHRPARGTRVRSAPRRKLPKIAR